ncbi:MAG: amidohydrolase family protein [Putridiphycobacter sp.]
MFKHILFIFFGFNFISLSIAQQIEPQNGVYQSNHTYYALSNAKIYVNATNIIDNGTLLIKNGKVVKVGRLLKLPKNCVEINLKGYTIYPAFIDPYSDLGVTKRTSKKKSPYPQLKSLKEGPYYWNEAIHPETNGYELLDASVFNSIPEKPSVEMQWLSNGFATVNVHQSDGIYRGTSALLNLDGGDLSQNILKAKVANHFSFSKGVSKQTYPSSQMGAIALLRQFFYDLIWYKSISQKDFDNMSFNAAIQNYNLPHIFAVSDKLEIFRALKIAEEFRLKFVIKGSGDEYERVEEISKLNPKLIIPLNYPKPFDVSDPFAARYIKLSQLKHWEMAPYNPYILEKNNIDFAFTLDGLKSKQAFLKNLRKSVKCGLSKTKALQALTEMPSKILGVEHLVGTLDKGKYANFVVVKGDLFEDGEIYETWVNGHPHTIKNKDLVDFRGDYDFKIGAFIYPVSIKGSSEKPKGKIYSYYTTIDSTTELKTIDTTKANLQINMTGLQISAAGEVKDSLNKGVIQLNGSFYPDLGIFEGNALLPNGNWVKWNGIKNKHFKTKPKATPLKVDTSALANITYPNMAYGFDSLPETGGYFIKNATLWTNEKEGVIKNANLLIVDGKIKSVNKSNLKIPNGTVVIDAKGKHVTSGIIDEHSHIAISKGVNESGQAISAEVSIADVVRSDDINIYRQLSGGVTCSQLLHGSANPIGGQSALIKLKWGFTPDEMLVKDADGFIKFALGENVKQSNWGEYNVVRFPQTRMGVEQVFYDAFTRAKNYKQQWVDYQKLSAKEKAEVLPPRKDLEMEVVLQVLESQRFITCHSYVQSEINMLMHVADSMGFTVNTFTHILEGYKVADKMKVHGAGGSTFSDWWAYKYEVNEAIPYNAAILHKMGIVTALNSDDAEMGRRLNQEAAKIVKYGGISEQDAWKMVTLNPAILLHVDDRMGSLKEGKDADIVIWSDHPLSINAKVEQTFVDGMLLYDVYQNEKLNKRDQLERKRIIKLMLEAKNNGEPTQKPTVKKEKHYHCDTIESEYNH